MVLDASAVLEYLLGSRKGRAARERMEAASEHLHAPALLDAEVMQVLRRLEADGRVAEPRARATVDLLRRLPVERHALAPLLPRMWDLRSNLTAYDAAYVALAEGLDAPLLTLDGRIARALGHRARVVVV